jgi:hypothetical protein
MAGVYQALQWAFGLHARDRADLFCYALTLTSSGLAYILAGWGLYRLARVVGLPPGLRLGLTASLTLATIALPYARHVNSHIVLLALAMWLFGFLHELLAARPQPAGADRLLLIGTLAGLAYAVEQAAGGLLLAGSLGIVALGRPRARGLILASLAALPWVLLHHGIVYGFAHTLRPVGAVPEFFRYENSYFDETNLTGLYHHASLGDCLLYAAGLLVGSRGFLLSNVPLWLALLAGRLLVPSPRPTRPVLLLACAWGAGTWLTYALLSNNYAGICCSIRWFVPLLAPAYYLLALLLRDHPACRPDFLFLNAWGIVLAAVMWYDGPWSEILPYNLFWPFQAVVLGSWALYRLYRRYGQAASDPSRPEPRALSTAPS